MARRKNRGRRRPSEDAVFSSPGGGSETRTPGGGGGGSSGGGKRAGTDLELVIKGWGELAFDKKDVRDFIDALWQSGMETLVDQAIEEALDDHEDEYHTR